MRGMQAKHTRSNLFFIFIYIYIYSISTEYYFQKYKVRCTQWLDVCIYAGSRSIAYNLLHYLGTCLPR